MRYQTCAALWSSCTNALRSGDSLVNKRLLLRAVLVGILFIAGIYQLSSYFLSSESDSGDSSEALSVLVADRYIPPFSVITPKTIRVRDFPRGFVPPGAMHSADALVDGKGQPVFLSAVPLPEGQVLSRNILHEIGKSHGLASLLSNGKVAVSFAADKERGVGSWVQPGDTIALYETPGTDTLGKGLSHTRLLFPAVLVLGVDHSNLALPKSEDKDANQLFAPSDESNTVITIALNIAQAPLFIQAREQGHLTAALRALGDEGENNDVR